MPLPPTPPGPTPASAERTAWFTPENPTGTPGEGGRANRGVKGRPFVALPAGGALDLVDVRGTSGRITRIWVTLSDRDPATLMGVDFQAFWEGCDAPAVDVPLAAFFGAPLGDVVAFGSAYFGSPEGRSLVSRFPMAFRSAARLRLVNRTGHRIDRVFHEVDAVLGGPEPTGGWLHARHRREERTRLGEPFEALGRVEGRGRLLGLQLAVRADPSYGQMWWGEGEVRLFVDADEAHPSLVATGIEDWVGSGWGLGSFATAESGCPHADLETPEGRAWDPYRLHVGDPVTFRRALRITVDVLGGGPTEEVARLVEDGAALVPVSTDVDGVGLVPLLDPPTAPGGAGVGWTNALRSDDYAATAWFLLDRPAPGPLPEGGPVPGADTAAGSTPPPGRLPVAAARITGPIAPLVGTTLPEGIEAIGVDTGPGTLTALLARAVGAARGTALLVPGFTGSKEDFLPLLPELAARGWTVWTYSQRGQADSVHAAADRYRLEDFASDLAAVARAIAPPAPGAPAPGVPAPGVPAPGAPTLHLLGHSLGGVVARRAVIDHPELFADLVLLGSGPRGWSSRKHALAEALASGDPRRLDDVVREIRGDGSDPFVAARTGLHDPACLLAQISILQDPEDTTPLLRRTGVPTLVAFGARDFDTWPQQWFLHMAAELGAALEVVPDAAHCPNQENPTFTADLLDHFWSGRHTRAGDTGDPSTPRAGTDAEPGDPAGAHGGPTEGRLSC